MKKLDERENGAQKSIIQMSPRHTMEMLFIHAEETSTEQWGVLEMRS